MSTEITFPGIQAHIAEHATHEDLDRLIEVIKTRRTTLRSITAAAVTTGAAVEIQEISPAVLKGKRGTVAKIDSRHASVALDAESVEAMRGTQARGINVPLDATEYTVTGIPLGCLRLT